MTSPKADRRAIAEGERRAQEFLRSAPTCPVCRNLVATRGRRMHHGCDPDYPLAGLTCTCPPDCTTNRIGDGPRTCDPGCVVCKRFRDRLRSELFRGR